MNRTITFSSRYKGWFLDTFLEGIRNFFGFLFSGWFLTFVVFFALKLRPGVGSGLIKFVISFLIIGSFVLAICSPFIFRHNKNLRGTIRIDIDDINLKAIISSSRKDKHFYEEFELNYFKEKKRVFYLGKNETDSYRIPKKVLRPDDVSYIASLKGKIDEKRKQKEVAKKEEIKKKN